MNLSTAGVMRGTVTRVRGGAVYAVIPKLGRGERGPLVYALHRITVEVDAFAVGVPVGQWTGWTAAPEPGDTVLVAAIDGSLDDLIVIGVQS